MEITIGSCLCDCHCASLPYLSHLFGYCLKGLAKHEEKSLLSGPESRFLVCKIVAFLLPTFILHLAPAESGGLRKFLVCI